MKEIPHDNLLPSVSIDCVLFGYHEGSLKVLLLKMKGLDRWALPGGFVEEKQDLDEAASKVLEQRTGLHDIYLKQFHAFGKYSRHDSSHTQQMVSEKILDEKFGYWLKQRFITIGYLALVDYDRVQQPVPDAVSEKCEWFSLEQLPDLMLDHQEILDAAYTTLQKELNSQPIGLNLLPEEFTIPELQGLYETILGKPLDRRNFRRKLLSFDILVSTGKYKTGVAHKAPLLYRFDLAKYKLANLKGLDTGWS